MDARAWLLDKAERWMRRRDRLDAPAGQLMIQKKVLAVPVTL
jgi:hypothetical protein